LSVDIVWLTSDESRMFRCWITEENTRFFHFLFRLFTEVLARLFKLQNFGLFWWLWNVQRELRRNTHRQFTVKGIVLLILRNDINESITVLPSLYQILYVKITSNSSGSSITIHQMLIRNTLQLYSFCYL
jgi:hypothetical protein